MPSTGQLEELLQCFDESGKPIGNKSRAEVLDNLNVYFCGVSNIWLVNDSGQIMCSRRSRDAFKNANKWQTYFGGHLPPGMTFAQNAVKELQEETGLSASENDLIFVNKGRHGDGKFFENFIFRFNGSPDDLKFLDGEISEAKWMSMGDYWQEKTNNPDSWCNSCRPEQQAMILSKLGKL